MHSFEPIVYGWKQGLDHFWCGARNQSDVFNVNKPRVNDLHPTMKPVELIEHMIYNSSRLRDLVLDPYAGAGSTMMACEKAGRRARLIEIEPQYVDVSIQRWQNVTGRQARLEAGGKTFSQIAGERVAPGSAPPRPAPRKSSPARSVRVAAEKSMQ
jgi:DNA modification methylase